NAELAQLGAPGSAQGVVPLIPHPGRFSTGRSQTKRHGAVPMGSNSPFFLPAVAYDSGGIYCGGTSNDSGSDFSRFVAVADLNGDGKPDVVATNCQNDTVGVLLGNGDGTFQSAVTYDAGGSESGSIAVADVKGDGR